MKKILFATLLLVFCLTTTQAQESKPEKLQNLVKGKVEVKIDNLDKSFPIVSFNAIASEKADEVIELSKDNMKEALTKAKNYSACVITVGKHTIAVVTDLKDCVASGAWGQCMPKGKGLIQKNGMREKEGYINNIIGVPDGQKRKMFLFK